MIRDLPRISFNNIRDTEEGAIMRARKHNLTKRERGGRVGAQHKGQRQRMSLPRLGFEGGQSPWYIKIPREYHYKDHHLRRHYQPLSLFQLQRLIDLNRLNINEPIDLSNLCNTKIIKVASENRYYGIELKDDGMDIFETPINIEVQQIESEHVIAAIERSGGIVTCKYLDLASVSAASDPRKFFEKGLPIPKVGIPPLNCLDYYRNPENRGYLADPEEVTKHRKHLAQKYGYQLNLREELMEMPRKMNHQLFHGLNGGWIVNLKDRSIIKPTSKQWKEFYSN
ncbi:hypothetical protein SNEBB_001016 [Seison nebaliae]|nr:hypothetical protein SNEBB_001016 [Seison nebaliae]